MIFPVEFPQRTCTRKHYCEREKFLRDRSYGPNVSYYPHRFEVIQTTKKEDGPEDEDDDEYDREVIFLSDSEGEVKQFLVAHNYRFDLSFRENGCCTICDAYERRKEGILDPILIVVWGVSRYCYSQAEGGCYSDWTDILEVRQAFTFKKALKHARELKEKYPTQRYNRYSVLGNGDDTYVGVFYGEDDPRFPTQSTKRATYS